jgi:hypothetical protein
MEMNRRIAAITAAVGLSASLAVAPAPAQAETCVAGVCIGGKVFHRADANYDPAIIVYCNFNSDTPRYVAENTSSTQDCGVDTDQIYIRAGEELWCKNGNILEPWQKEFDAPGRHKINDLWSKSCTLRRD